MKFGLLGPLQVSDDGRDVRVPAPQQRMLLSALLLAGPGRVLAFEDLSEVLWERRPSHRVRGALHSAVQRLRVTLGPRGQHLVQTRPPGYLVDVAPEDLDVCRFEVLLAQGESAGQQKRWAQATTLLSQALGLWRGDPLADVPSAQLHDRHGQYLRQQYLRALSARIEADLHLSRHEALVPELAQLTSEHPLSEGFHRQLMLALYRARRQADALAAYQNVRRLLIDQLGTEPGPDLQDLHQRILAADPSLAAAASVEPSRAVSEPVTAARSPADTTPQRTPPLPAQPQTGTAQARAVPRQLPAGPAQFTGRADELSALTMLLAEADAAGGVVPVAVVVGTAGVGKTALAVHWAHRMADRFPDGHLFANLGGFSADDPVGPAEIIRGFLDALGAEPEQMPLTVDAQAALYRSLLAGRRMLIVLDNAHDASQVRPLLPGHAGCRVLVTSRRRLAGLAAAEGAHLLHLHALTATEARELLTRRLGSEKAAAEPGTVTQLATLCGRLPLALVITAARAAADPFRPLSSLAAELRNEHSRLDALDTDEAAISARAFFSSSYQKLGGSAKRLFRMLGLHPGPDITTWAAASLAAVSPDQVRSALHELVTVSLLSESAQGRYAMHDLLRSYAAEQASAVETEEDRRAALHRTFDHYLHTACAAALLIKPTKDAPVLQPPQHGAVPEHLSTPAAALAWLHAERLVLSNAVFRAAAAGFPVHSWQLSWALVDYLDRQGRWSELATLQRPILAVAEASGDVAG